MASVFSVVSLCLLFPYAAWGSWSTAKSWVFALPANTVYMLGTTTKVSAVDANSPPMTAIAMPDHISAPSPISSASGTMDKIVVRLVSSTGRNRVRAAVEMASTLSKPCSR